VKKISKSFADRLYITLPVNCGPQAAGRSVTDLQDVSEWFILFFCHFFLLYFYDIISRLVCLGNML
jgi:hypothetical protein